MKRILSEVSAADMRGPLDKLMELLTNEKSGHYWLHQLTLMMRKEPTHVLTQKWLGDLANKYTWEHAEEHFLKTKELWFNEPTWPFQICVLPVDGMSNELLCMKWERNNFNSDESILEDIKHLPFFSKRKIYLIRLQARFLGFVESFEFRKINCSHPGFNLSQCPPETSFFMRPLVKQYFEREITIVTTDFSPPDMVDKGKKRVYWFNHDRGYGHDIQMGAWDISDKAQKIPDTWFIFQYNL